MNLGAWIAAARRYNHGKVKLTQQELADLLSVSKQNISAWENNHHEPSFAQLLRISELTGHPLPGVQAGPYPLSKEVRDSLAMLDAEQLRRIENQVRATLDLEPVPRVAEPSKARVAAA